MKKLLCILIILSSASAFAQTHTIAHKSHSGGPNEIDRTGIDRFGEYIMPPRLVKVSRIQNEHERATIFHYQSSMTAPYTQRVDEHPVFNAPTVNLDSVKKAMGWQEVEFEGFEPAPIQKEHSEGHLLPTGSAEPAAISFALLAVMMAFVFLTKNEKPSST